MRYYMLTFPWDLFDEGLDAAIDRLHGDIGITGLTITAASEPVDYIRSRKLQPRLVQSQGGLLFTPDDSCYESTRVKPTVSSHARPKNAFALIGEACTKRGMEFRFAASATRIGRMAARYPGAACKNLYGGVSETTLCLCNPDVRSLVVGLCRDLKSNYAPSEIVLDDLDPVWRPAFQLAGGPPYDGISQDLLSICFCESCRQLAGEANVNADAALKYADKLISKFLDGGRPLDDRHDLDEIVEASDELSAYTALQLEAAASLATTCREAVGGGLVLGTMLDEESEAELVPRFLARIETPDRLEDLSAEWNDVEASDAQIATDDLHEIEAPACVMAMSGALDSGWRSVQFGPYGMLSEDVLAKLRRAIRYARRST